MKSATLIRSILRNKGITKIDPTGMSLVERPVLSSVLRMVWVLHNTLIEIVLADTRLDDDGLSILAESLGHRTRHPGILRL
jgi:hypothetical protein